MLDQPRPRPARLDLPPPLTDVSAEGMARAIEADSIGTRLLNGESPLEPHLDPDAAWAMTATPDPFRNVVVSARFDEASADGRIVEIAAAFARRGTPFLWWRAPFHSPADLGERLERAGISEIAAGPGMALDLRSLPNPEDPPAGLEIHAVTDVEGLRAYLDVLSSELAPADEPDLFPPGTIEAIIEHTGPRLADEPIPMRYLGRLAGHPVATSRVSLAGGVAGIYAVHTQPDVRGRGIGRAMTLAPLQAARTLGYRIATLQSTEAGFGVYRAIGFEEVFRYAIHVGGWKP
jgi:GNAT superfamily N-acetyltransferase